MTGVELPDYSDVLGIVIGVVSVAVVFCSLTPKGADSKLTKILNVLARNLNKPDNNKKYRAGRSTRASTRRGPLCDVTVFKGPNGIFSVAQDGDLWSVEKTPDARDNSFNRRESLPPGRTSFKTRFPIAPNDEHAGSFDRRDKAIKSAIKWSGLWPHLDTVPTHPTPNRRAAIAHTKAKS